MLPSYSNAHVFFYSHELGFALPAKTTILLFTLLLITGPIMLLNACKIAPKPVDTIKTTSLVTDTTRKPFTAPGVKIDSTISFKKATAENVMKAISHHYQVPVIYRGKKPTGTFSASINVNMECGEMVDLLNSVGIKATYDGRKIIVTN